MKRRVIMQRDSYTVTLPIKWVKAKRLKPGDEIDVDVESGRIIIDSEARPELASVRISEVTKQNIFPVIGTAYRAGYSRIALALKDKISMTCLQKTIDFFNGLEIEDFRENEVSLRCTAAANAEEYEFFVKKMFLTIKMMFDEIINFFEGKGLSFNNIADMRKTNLKAREYCMRAINIQKTGRKEACDEYTFINILEKISGSLWYAGRYIKNNKVKESAEIKKLLLFLKGLTDKSHRAYLKKDYEFGVRNVLSAKDPRSEWFRQNKILKSYQSKGTDPVLVSLMLDIKDKIITAMERYLSTIIKTG